MGRRHPSALGPFPLAALAAGTLLAASAPAAAQTPAPPGGGFGLPVDCRMGELCNIQNYIDHDPGPGRKDHTCGSLTYDGHRGIDFRLPTQIEMRRGVAVVAAAAGEVILAEDGQPDLLMEDTGPGKTPRERNGNWVVVSHAGRWVTTYAHLREGTVAVRRGERVERGQKLGLIGLSGNSDFPHLHFAVTHKNKLLDPFTGQEPSAACGEATESLWSPAAQAQLGYRAGGLLSAGFLGRVPDRRQMLAGIQRPAEVSAKGRLLVFWAANWGLRAGDLVTQQILRPDGSTFYRKEVEIEKDLAIWTTHFGLRQEHHDLRPGEYIGFFRVRRPENGWPRTVLSLRETIAVR